MRSALGHLANSILGTGCKGKYNAGFLYSAYKSPQNAKLGKFVCFLFVDLRRIESLACSLPAAVVWQTRLEASIHHSLSNVIVVIGKHDGLQYHYLFHHVLIRISQGLEP